MKVTPYIFIKNWVIKNQAQFNFNKIEYEFNDYSGTHFIYCEPQFSNLSIHELELFTELIIEFENQFNSESIGLIDETSLTELKNPITVFESKPKILTSKFNFNLEINENQPFNFTFTQPDIQKNYQTELKENKKKINYENQFALTNLISHIISSPSIFFDVIIEPNEVRYEVPSDDDFYSLAA